MRPGVVVRTSLVASCLMVGTGTVAFTPHGGGAILLMFLGVVVFVFAALHYALETAGNLLALRRQSSVGAPGDSLRSPGRYRTTRRNAGAKP